MGTSRSHHLPLLWLLAALLAPVRCQFLAGKEHVTTKAAEQLPPIWCYQCESMEPVGPCVNITRNNNSHELATICPKELRMCMVRRYSYTTSTENSTSSPRMWALERNCTEKCDAGCIVIGERTKLYSCTSCCATSLCNVGSGGQAAAVHATLLYVVYILSATLKA